MRFACLLSFVCLGFSGCSLFTVAPDDDFAGQMSGANMPEVARYQVVIEGYRGRPRVETFELTGPTTVQEAIEKADAIRPFGKMEVEIVRTPPQSQRPHKMPVSFDSRTDHVLDEQNYAVFANDRIVVRYDQGSPIDGVLQAFGMGG